MSAPAAAYRVEDLDNLDIGSDGVSSGGVSSKNYNYYTNNQNHHYHLASSVAASAATPGDPSASRVMIPVDIQGGSASVAASHHAGYYLPPPPAGSGIAASSNTMHNNSNNNEKCCDASSLMECGLPDACTNELHEENLIKRQQRKPKKGSSNGLTGSTDGGGDDQYYQMNDPTINNNGNDIDNRHPVRRFVERERNLLIACLVLVFALNVSTGRYLLYPFMIISTWVHEMCHGIAAILMGGFIAKLEIFKDGSGLAYTGGVTSNFGRGFVASAGYPGTSVIGCILLLFRRTTLGPTIGTIGVGSLMVLSCALWVRNTWGLVVLLIEGFVLMLLGWKLPAVLLDNLYAFVAVTVSLNAFESIHDLFASGDMYVGGEVTTTSDAHTVADMWGLYYLEWAIIWLCISVFLSAVGIIFAFDAKRFVTSKTATNNNYGGSPVVDAQVVQVYPATSSQPTLQPVTTMPMYQAQPYGGENQNESTNNTKDGFVMVPTATPVTRTKSKRKWFRFGGGKK
mmetsp:Transcript_55291/g.134299  ORF Transcript_55291/g.134299 Transcript_55291/m.134299 type:complete len:512 (+) Transcript_55291:280-1815(+)